MNKVSVFNFKSNPVRSITKDGEPWFVASDVCGALGLENVSMAVARLDDDEKADISMEDLLKALHTLDMLIAYEEKLAAEKNTSIITQPMRERMAKK